VCDGVLCEIDDCLVELGARWAVRKGIEDRVEDARQQGWVYLLEAKKSHDPGRGRWGMYAHHAIRSSFIDQLRASQRRVQPGDCFEIEAANEVGSGPRFEERIDALRSIERLESRGMDVAAAIGGGSGRKPARGTWGIE
jgi:DNA-directed RNA polymerase specialized sigma24 family protein